MLGWSRLSGLLQASAPDGGGWEVCPRECGQCSEGDRRREGPGRGSCQGLPRHSALFQTQGSAQLLAHGSALCKPLLPARLWWPHLDHRLYIPSASNPSWLWSQFQSLETWRRDWRGHRLGLEACVRFWIRDCRGRGKRMRKAERFEGGVFFHSANVV